MFELILIGILIIVSIQLAQYYKRTRTTRQLIDKLPGPKSYFPFGSVFELIRVPRNKRIEHIESWIQQHGYLFRFWVGTQAVVNISNPEDVEVILSSRHNISKSFAYELLHSWLGTGLLTSSGLKWHQRRKMLTPAFHFSILETFFPVLVENSNVLALKIESNVGNQTEFDIFPIISQCTLDIICETAMGVKLNTQSGDASDYIGSVTKMNEIISYKMFRPWLLINWIYALTKTSKQETKALQILHNMSLNVIQLRKQARIEEKTRTGGTCESESEPKKRKAFLDVLLDIMEESSVHMSDTDIREEVDTFMFEGHDTTSSAVSLAIYMLGTHPDVQNKVAEEIFSIFGTSDRPPTMNDIAQLKYLECVIKETLRLCPAVPFIGRNLTEGVQLGGHVIPAGTTIDINIFGLHRNPNIYPNPGIFNPDNFSPENSSKRHHYAFIPFSAGPRNCIGFKFAMLEEKTILLSLFRKYKITASQSMEELSCLPESILRPDNGVKIKVSPREW